MAAILGLLAGVLTIVDAIPYLRDVLRGSTRPHRGTWLIWSVLASLSAPTARRGAWSWSPPRR
jgi:hypothetical protein